MLSPNMYLKPKSQKAKVAIQKTMRFLARTLTALRVRQNPVSSMAKPAFIKNTSAAATISQTVPTASKVFAIAVSWAADLSANRNRKMTDSAKHALKEMEVKDLLEDFRWRDIKEVSFCL